MVRRFQLSSKNRAIHDLDRSVRQSRTRTGCKFLVIATAMGPASWTSHRFSQFEALTTANRLFVLVSWLLAIAGAACLFVAFAQFGALGMDIVDRLITNHFHRQVRDVSSASTVTLRPTQFLLRDLFAVCTTLCLLLALARIIGFETLTALVTNDLLIPGIACGLAVILAAYIIRQVAD
jgi:hypothetical protein